eukprot:XP_001693220.1 dopamine beta-monooxygenase-like protein [Chlamydomonas reinhardtii]
MQLLQEVAAGCDVGTLRAAHTVWHAADQRAQQARREELRRQQQQRRDRRQEERRLSRERYGQHDADPLGVGEPSDEDLDAEDALEVAAAEELPFDERKLRERVMAAVVTSAAAAESEAAGAAAAAALLFDLDDLSDSESEPEPDVNKCEKDPSAGDGAGTDAESSQSGTDDALTRLRWLRRRGYPADGAAVIEAAQHGNTAALAFLLHRCDATPRWEAADAAAEGGHLGCLRLLRAARATMGQHTLSRAAQRGRLRVVRWLAERADLGVLLDADDDSIMSAAAGTDGGCEEAIEWMAAHGCPMGVDGLPYVWAGINGDFATLACLRRLGCPWDPQGGTFLRALRSHRRGRWCSVPALQWLLGEGCPVGDWEALLKAARVRGRDYMEVVNWVERVKKKQEEQAATGGGGVEGKTWDWVGIGLSEGGMLGADLAVAALEPGSTQWTATDYWSAGFGFPARDVLQDVTLVAVSRAGGSTQVALRRPLVSCDLAQDRAVVNDTRQTVVWAVGSGGFAYHGPVNRGQAEVVLLPNATTQANLPLPADVQTLELKMPAFTIPGNATTYQCVNLEMPHDAKYHVYRYEPIIDNTPYVHHFVAWTCYGLSDADAPATPLGSPYDCLGYMECSEFWMGWAPGLNKVDAEAQAALAFGSGTPKRYLALQIHYTNLQGVQGQVDSSGFRIHYSPTLKKYDMGVLTLGTHDIAVPAGAPSYTTAPNVCPGTCTSQLAAAGPITLIESFYHMHQLGKSMVTRHVRGGQELSPLGTRDYYDFAYQAPVNVPPPSRTLLPGDSLITTCTYSGVGRSNVTKFGEASYEEMCFNFLFYYPFNDSISYCITMDRDLSGMASCSSIRLLQGLQSQDAFNAAVQASAGEIVSVPANATTYKPYNPTCARTAPGAPGSSSSQPASGGEGEPQEEKHRRNVGAAVITIIIIACIGGVAIWGVLRWMRVKRQAEEEQHLFQKYNPNTVGLPLVGATNSSSAPIGSKV